MISAVPGRRGEKQRERLYDWVCAHVQRFGRAPSYRESALALGIKHHSTVQHHINGLCASGKLRLVHERGRTCQFEFYHPDGTWHPTPPPKVL